MKLKTTFQKWHGRLYLVESLSTTCRIEQEICTPACTALGVYTIFGIMETFSLVQ